MKQIFQLLLVLILYSQSFLFASNSEVLQSQIVFESVNILTGEYCEAQTDLHTGGVYPFTLRRSYNSQDSASAEWDFNISNLFPSENKISTEEFANYKNLYKCDEKNRITQITIADLEEKLTYHNIAIKYSEDNTIVEIETSEKQNVLYHFIPQEKNRFESRYLLKSVLCNDNELTTYEYCQHPQERRQLIAKKDNGDGRYQIIIYDDQGRVIELKGPDSNSLPITISRFVYNKGSTEVYNALGFKTIYQFSSKSYLDSIEEYDEYGALYRRERFIWDKHNSSNCNLNSRLIEDGNNNIISCETYLYDNNGNKTKKTLYGNLSGKNFTPIILDQFGIPKQNDVESYSTIYRYSENFPYQLILEKDDNGNTIRYAFDSKSNLLTSKLQYFHNKLISRTFLNYDECGLLISSSVDDGQSKEQSNLCGATEIHFTKNILRHEMPAVGMPEIIEDYCYNFCDNPQEQYCYKLSDNVGKLAKRTVNHYSEQNNIIQQDIYDSENQFCYSTHANYDAHGRVIFTDYPEIIKKDFDTHGNKIKEIFTNADDLQTEKSFSYDCSNRLIQIEELRSNSVLVTKFCYDALGNQLKAIDPCDNEILNEFDAFGRIVKTTFPALLNASGSVFNPSIKKQFDIFKSVISVCDANGFETKTCYNIRGKPIRITFPDNSEEIYEYNLDGGLAFFKDRNGLITIYESHFETGKSKCTQSTSAGEIISCILTHSNFFHVYAVESKSILVEYFYDLFGRKKSEVTTDKETGQTLKKIHYDYDTQGNVVANKEWYKDDPNCFKKTVFKRDDNGTILEYYVEDNLGKILKNEPKDKAEKKSINENIDYHFQNELGQFVVQKKITNSNGTLHIATYNAHGNIAHLQQKNSLGELISQQEFRYDGVGNKTLEIIAVLVSGKQHASFVNSWKYGPCNHLEEVVEGLGTFSQQCTRYFHNAYGKLDCIQKPDGNLISYKYNNQGKISEYFAQDNSFHYSYEYDDSGNVNYAKNWLNDSFTKRVYNTSSQLIEEILENGLKLSFSYDMCGRCTNLVLPDGSSAHYRYDALHLKDITRVNASNAEIYKHTYLNYDLEGYLATSQLIGNLGNLTYQRDQNHNIQSISSPYWSEILDRNDTQEIIKTSFVDPSGAFTNYFQYNERSELINEDGHCTHEYIYNSLQNITCRDSTVRRFDEIYQIINNNKDSYQYDLNGNLIKKSIDNVVTNYSYDGLDRLIEVENSQMKINYIYDFLGRRMSKLVIDKYTQATEHAKFIYDDICEIGTTDVFNNIKELRILAPSANAELGSSIAIEIHDKVFAPIHDHRGSLCCLINTRTAEIAEYYRYSAYGECTAYDTDRELPITKRLNPWKFASKRFDTETGLIYFGMRYYDPHLGQWITKDPLGHIDGNNRYAFVQNNPISNMDAHGLFSFKQTWETITSSFKNVFGKYSPLGNMYNYFREKLSLSYQLKANIDNLATKVFGKYYLQFAGYFVDRDEVGVYGNGEINDKIRVTLINGILNARFDAIEVLKHISNNHGGVNIHYIFRPTEGWTWDFIKSFFIKAGYRSPHAKKLAATWKAMIAEMGGVDGGGLIIHYAHSLGAKDTASASFLMTPEELKMIQVITMGSPTFIESNGFESVTNYISKRDGVGFLDPINYIKALFGKRDNIVFIGSWLGIPFIDHYIGSKTYKNLIEMLGGQFVELYGGL